MKKKLIVVALGLSLGSLSYAEVISKNNLTHTKFGFPQYYPALEDVYAAKILREQLAIQKAQEEAQQEQNKKNKKKKSLTKDILKL